MAQQSSPDWQLARRSLLAHALANSQDLDAVEGRSHAPRPFCGIGVCLECETEIDGKVVRACLIEATEWVST